jgi:hypothetical protein
MWATSEVCIRDKEQQSFCSPSGYVVMDDVSLLFKGRLIFKQYIPKKHKCFGINIYILCNMIGYQGTSTYSVGVLLGKARQNSTWMVTAAHATVRGLTRRLEREVAFTFCAQFLLLS